MFAALDGPNPFHIVQKPSNDLTPQIPTMASTMVSFRGANCLGHWVSTFLGVS